MHIVRDDKDTQLIWLGISQKTSGVFTERSPLWRTSFSYILICLISPSFGALKGTSPSTSKDATRVARVDAPQSTPLVVLEQSLGATTALVIPLERKRKSHKEEEKSSSKRSRRDGSIARPLPSGVFNPEFNVSHNTNFHMNSTERAVMEPPSEGEVTNIVLKLSTRATMLS